MTRKIRFKAWLSCINKMTYTGAIEDIIKWAPFGCNPIWLQFSGLNDIKGVDIYEGDNVLCFLDSKEPVGAIDTITFQNGSFWLFRRNIAVSTWVGEMNGELEVCGNIYQIS